ncbi:MAG TPA: ADOP family duplicated permease [Acidobacteriota bacterium]
MRSGRERQRWRGDLAAPPLWARWALRWLLRRDDRSVVIGDLAELYALRRARDGERAAAAWLRRQWAQVPLQWMRARLRLGPSTRDIDPRSRRNRSGRPGEPMQNFWRDVHHSFRSLSRSPVLSATIVLTVGLGIGATTAIFGVIHAVLLKPLPYADPERLVRIYTDAPPNRWNFSLADYLALAEQQTRFQQVAAYANTTMTFSRGALAERIHGKFVSPTYFPLLGVAPLHGRLLSPIDSQPGSERTVIVSHGFWARYLGGDPGALGRRIRLDGDDYTVVGVLRPEVGPFEHGKEFFAAAQWQTPPRRGPFNIIALGRLRADTERGAAAEELRAINRRIFPLWQSSYQDQRATWGMIDLKEQVVGDRGPTLLIVLAAVGFLLLIACTNAANLLLARATERSRELAVRRALGASRGRLALHLLAESALLAVGSALLGLWIAAAAIDLLAVAGADFIPRTQEIRLSGPVLLFLAALTAGSGLLFGLIPALHAVRLRLDRAIHTGGSWSTASGRQRGLRRVLVAAQFAVATPLLIAAGLLIGSLAKLEQVDPGFDPSGLLTAALALPAQHYQDSDAIAAFWSEAEERLAALPGVQALGFSDGRPPKEVYNINNFDLEDFPTPAGESQPATPWVAVTRGYFDTLGLRLFRGRLLDHRDQAAGAPPVVVVDQSWARRYFPGADAIGRRFKEGGCTECDWTTVVGIVSDVKYSGLDRPVQGTVYWPLAQRPADSELDQASARFRFLVIRGANDPLSLMPAIRRVVRGLDPELPITEVATIDELIADSLETPRYLSLLVGTFALAALLLSVIGIYGVTSHFVQQRSKDIGIRIALGGAPSRVLRLVVGQGMRTVGLGLIAGLGAAWMLTRYLASLLFEIRATDAGTFVAVSTLMLAVALIACLIPGRRATGIDPAAVLRDE